MTATKWTILALLVLVPLQIMQYVTTRGMILDYRVRQQLEHFDERSESDAVYAWEVMGLSAGESAEVYQNGRRLFHHAFSDYDKVSLDNNLAALFFYEEDGFYVYRWWQDSWVTTDKIPYDDGMENTTPSGVKVILRQDKQ